MQYLKDLFKHNAEVAEKIMKAMRTVDKRKFIEEKISGKGSLRDVVVHIFGAEDHWINGIIGKKEYAHHRGENFIDYEEIEKAWRKAHDDIRRLLEKLTPEKLAETRTIKWDKEYRFPVEKILQHVYTHSIHHSGQAVAGIRLLGGQAPDVDMI